MLCRLKHLSLSLAIAAASAGSAAAAPIAFDLSGPGAADVDTNPGTEVDLDVFIAGTIVDLNVVVHITGGHMEDLDLFLTSPGGTTVQFRRNFTAPLFHQDGPLMATFDDSAASGHESQSSPPIGTFQPFQALSAFNGENLAGVWTLTILDPYVPDEEDALVEWRLTGLVDTDPGAVPEPLTMVLLGAGLLGLAATRRRSSRT